MNTLVTTISSPIQGVSSHPYAGSAKYGLNLALHVGDDDEVVSQNRAILESHIGIPIAFMNQVHGDDIYVVTSSVRQTNPTADALITQERGVALAVLGADCLPLLLWSEDGKTIAAVHIGRRGLINSVGLKTVAFLRNLTSAPLYAQIGPHICGRCYEVKDDVAMEVRDEPRYLEFDKYEDALCGHRDGRITFDLASPLKRRLSQLGVSVQDSNQCTFEGDDLYSFRRDPITGRFATLIWR